MRFTVISLGIAAAFMISSVHGLDGVGAISDIADKGTDGLGSVVGKVKDAASDAVDGGAGKVLSSAKDGVAKAGNVAADAKSGASDAKNVVPSGAGNAAAFAVRRSFKVRSNLRRGVNKRRVGAYKFYKDARVKREEADEDENEKDEEEEDEDEGDEDKNDQTASPAGPQVPIARRRIF
ncbi:hypothetical protein EDC94DRAFT_625166 [Helicostylum pulchrum]|uniref:Uncharacterized protein n=1 Tax=Helicostylum pulchrum TaxID=562976 RepID=A0ABP9YBQ4_9FUNG|nr:hypothetical protein EDC94DRAFT_625166 [Helicostylum pulchrum]